MDEQKARVEAVVAAASDNAVAALVDGLGNGADDRAVCVAMILDAISEGPSGPCPDVETAARILGGALVTRFSGYDAWLESGPGGPYEGDERVACQRCDGTGREERYGDTYECRDCCGDGWLLASDCEDEGPEDDGGPEADEARARDDARDGGR